MNVLQAAGPFANDCQAPAREQDFRIDRRGPRVELSVRMKRS